VCVCMCMCVYVCTATPTQLCDGVQSNSMDSPGTARSRSARCRFDSVNGWNSVRWKAGRLGAQVVVLAALPRVYIPRPRRAYLHERVCVCVCVCVCVYVCVCERERRHGHPERVNYIASDKETWRQKMTERRGEPQEASENTNGEEKVQDSSR
jgi:hypothetical protein